jgi:drug/metabolite transporter (DMT)-like permease
MTASPSRALGLGSTSAVAWLILAALETGAQLAIKLAADTTAAAGTGLSWIVSLLMNPWFLASIGCDAAGFLLWLALLRRHDLSFAVPLSSLCYFSIVLASLIVLGEPLRAVQALGLISVGIGIYLIASESASQTAVPVRRGDELTKM